MDLGQNFVCDWSRGSPSSGVGSCGFLSSDVLDKWFSVCWYWPRDQQVVCLVVFGQESVCLVILGQVVRSVKWLWVKRLWVLWLSVCLCSFKRLSVWNVGLSDW